MAQARQKTLSFCIVTALLLLGGCSYDRHPEIPSDAMMSSEGDRELQFRANEPGMVYIFDRNDNRMVYSGEIDRGQTITVDPANNRISMDGRTVSEKDLEGGHTERIFFKAQPITERHVIVEEHRETSR